jgi:hypothetical protein
MCLPCQQSVSILYHAGKSLEALLPQLKAAIVHAVHNSRNDFEDLNWLSYLNNFEDLATALVACKSDFYDATEGLRLTEEYQQQMLALRGLLGGKVLEHCLEKRYRVDYGTAERYEAFCRGIITCLWNGQVVCSAQKS